MQLIDWMIFYFALSSVSGSQTAEKNDQNKMYSLLQRALKRAAVRIRCLRAPRILNEFLDFYLLF